MTTAPNVQRSQPIRDRVFVAMPFKAPHSEDLWDIVHFACKRYTLNASRADQFGRIGPVIRDREEIQRAQIMIADLTGLNANVLYELGLAHADPEAIVLLCRQGQDLPFDLAGLRCIFYDLSTVPGQQTLIVELLRALEVLRPSAVSTVIIEGKLERTNSVVSDLTTLARHPDQALTQECVWFSGFLSTLAIGEEEPFGPGEEEYKHALFRERALLLELAQRGCPLRCIITPPHNRDLLAERIDSAVSRLRTLYTFINSSDFEELSYVESLISPFRQKNLYVIGHIASSEGFKLGLERGYALTLRQTGTEPVNASIAAQSALFGVLERSLWNHTPVKLPREQNARFSGTRQSPLFGAHLKYLNARRIRKRGFDADTDLGRAMPHHKLVIQTSGSAQFV